MILSIVFYERKNVIFMIKILNLRKIILFMMFFAIEFFLASSQFLRNYWIFINHGIFLRKIFTKTLLIPISKIKFSVAKFDQVKKRTEFLQDLCTIQNLYRKMDSKIFKIIMLKVNFAQFFCLNFLEIIRDCAKPFSQRHV